MMVKIHKKSVRLSGDVYIPEVLVKQMDNFVERNAIIDLGKNAVSNGKDSEVQGRYKCCQSCLKAFALIKASEMKLGQDTIDLLDAMFDCDTGHDGYYLDKEGLKDCRVSLHVDA
jgi:hypothetical protein